MAIQPKKNSTKKPSKKKSTPPKKRVSKKKTSFKKNIFIVTAILVTLFFVGLGYYLGKNDRDTMLKNIQTKEHYSTKALLDDLAQLKVKKPKKNVKDIVKKVPLKNTTKHVHKDVKEKKTILPKRKQKHNTVLAYRGKKPRLVIIIDDVHTRGQIEAIKKLGLKITPSIFPPYRLSKHSNLLAKQVSHYMIHLPMESGNKQFNKQTKTLMTSFTDEQILDRVMEIRKLFPNAKYINNHTGSVFTSNYKAMKKLYIALKLEGFVFVDSFTVASSKVNHIAHELGDAYVRRDIFIDNKHTIPYIHHQLKLAVAKAKKKGYAIAIGHPHKTTMQALASAKPILKDVELVYIDNIYR
ncbi:MAG TPA: divergent polysaccharide deacetylase family protein [Epsilonproteobacteria bacterium]|nr:divergent polysaccharide deacetylase family protein [Campylobacterota bacterium]